MSIITTSTITVTATVLAATFSMANFAYDASMINQLLLSESFFEFFGLNSTYIGLNVAIINVGNFVAGPFTGPLMDWLGRKKAIFLANCLGIMGIIIQASAQNEGMLLAGRCILGFSMTISAVAGPALVAEATPGHLHSILTNAVILALPVFGTIVAAGAVGVYKSTTNWGWRALIMGELAAPLLSSFCLLIAPESPRWLAFKDRPQEARRVLERIHSTSDPNRNAIIHTEYEEIVQTIEFERGSNENLSALVAKPSDRRRFIIVVLTNIFYQVCGANTLPYFFTLILQSSGITETRTTLFLNLGLTIWGTISVATGLWVCQRMGSKTVLLTHTSVIVVCLALLAVLTGLGPDNGRGAGAVFVVFVFWSASSSSWLILAYAYPPEVLRFSLRGKGCALGQAIGYGFCLIMNYTLPIALQNIGWRFYAINAAWDVGIVIVVWWLFAETKDKTLEEIDALFDGVVHFHVDGQDDVEVIDGVEIKSSEVVLKSTASSKCEISKV